MRMVILGTKSDGYIDIIYNRLCKTTNVVGIVLEDRESLSAFLKKRWKKYGIFKVLGQILFKIIAVPVLNIKSQRYILSLKEEFEFDTTPTPIDRLAFCRNMNDDSSINLIKALQPDLVLIKGTRILSPKLLQSVGCPFINIHAGITPNYRGVHGAYWACVNGDDEHCGVTVHLVDPGIDTGRIIYQERIRFNDRNNLVTYPIHQLEMGLRLLERVVVDLENGGLSSAPSVGVSRLWTHPGFFEYLWNGLMKNVW